MARNTPPYRPRPPEIKGPPGEGEYGQWANVNDEWEPGEERESSGAIQSRGLQKDGVGSGDGINEVPHLDKDDYIDAPSAEKKSPPKETPDWLKRARDAYRFSTSYVDSNYRKNWEDSIRAFNNQHPSDSKYNTELYRKRSNLFRPKTRAMIRKNEAAAAAAYFSNLELISVDPLNEGIKEERVSADVMKEIIKYRLTKSIPWFMIMMGAIQDSQVQGASMAHIYWKFVERYDEDGNVISREDTPVVDLFPIENLRIDAGASWLDPIESSPYLIHLIPMYWCDVKDRMKNPDPKGRRWKEYSASAAFAYSQGMDDSTRAARLGVQQDPTQQRREISDYDIVWVHRHIHRWDGEDWEFYTLSSEKLLTDPEPLRNTVWHGKRPYVMGRAIIETHKVIPTSLPMLIKGLQEEANEVQNQRIDNVKFALNKGYLVKRGKNVDMASLVRNTPGRITLVDDPEVDVKELQWQDVTRSAYLEQDRIDGDFNDVVGNFSPLQVQTQRTPRESSNTMKQLQAPASMMTEYMLKTHTETFAQPVLRHLMMLEQHYETDSVVLALAGEKAQMIQKYGVNEVTDEMLDKELTLNVHVGMGATDPVQKLQRFVYGVTAYAGICKMPPPGIDLKEIAREIFGLSGYQDGQRFMIDGSDPMVMKLMQQNKMLMMKLQQLGIQVKNREGANQAKIATTIETNRTRERIAHQTNLTKLEAERIKAGQSARETLAGHIMDLEMQHVQHAHDMEQLDMEHAHERDLNKQMPDDAGS